MKKIKISNFKFQIPKIFIFFPILILNFTFAAVAFSAEEAEHSFAWKDLLWPVINFAVLVAVLVIAARKPIREYFKKRTETVEKSLKEAREAKELAQKALDEVKERVKNVDSEINEILNAARNSGENEKEALIAEGERLRDKIIQQTKSNIEFELQKAKEAIKSEAAIMALELAEKQIKEKLGKKEQETLVDEYIKKLEVKK